MHVFSRIAVCTALFLGVVEAQQSLTYATLAGSVADASGAAIAGAVATLTNLDRNTAIATASGAGGRFAFSSLPAGSYRLEVDHPMFAAAVREFTVHPGQTLELPLELAVAGSNAVVEVRGEVPGIETARSQVSEYVAPREIDALPLNGRNYLDLALLSPGVSRTNTGVSQRFAETSAVPGTGISFSGQRNLNNSFVVDGLSANDDAAGLAGTFFSQEVIREFQVVSGGAVAEFGRASGGVVSIATRSGTNDWHGRLYGFLRNQRLDARNALATRKDPLTQAQYGASVGGPLRRDRTFLFTNFERGDQHAAGFVTIAPGNVAAINAGLDASGYPGPRLATGEYATGYGSINGFARVDHQLSAAHQLTARYSAYDLAAPNARSVGGLNAVSRGTRLDNRDQTVAVSETGSLAPQWLNEARFQFTRSRLAAPGNDLTGPAVNIAGVASFGASTSSPVGRDSDVYELADNISWQRGNLFVKTGANLLWNRVNIFFPGSQLAAVYSFGSLPDFLAGRYINVQQAFGDPRQFQSNPNLGGFVQAEWKPRHDLTLQGGLRYDVEKLPRPIFADTDNFAPRLGVAWSAPDRKTVVRAHYGVFYDRVPLRATSNALQRDGSKYRVALLSNGQDGAPAFPGQMAVFPAGQYINITTIDPHISTGYSQQAGFQVERELGAGTTLSAGYQWLRGLHLILSRNMNVPTLPGAPNLGRPDPRYGNVARYESSGDSYFNGLLVSLKANPARRLHVRVSYTLSKTIDDVGNFFFSTPQDNFNLRGDRGLSDNDQRHRISASAVWEVAGFEVAPMFLYTSALPFNIQTGQDRNRDTNLNDRPAGVGRNTGRGFDSATVDVRVSRTFRATERLRVDALAEAFNTLNRTNRQVPNNIYGAGTAPLASFGRATAVADPRQIQLGLRLSY